MRTTALAALATATAAMTGAPPAAASHETYRCRSYAVTHGLVTGGVWEGAAHGYVVGDAPEQVTVSCVLRVNGEVAAATPAGSGAGAAATAGRVTFSAADTDTVELCAVVTVHGATTGSCYRSEPVAVGWPWWLLDTVGPEPPPVDATVCPAFQRLAGTYGPVTITGQGDVYAAGEPQWDCPPYDIWPPS